MNAIETTNLGKTFQVRTAPPRSLPGRLLHTFRPTTRSLEAVRGLDLAVRSGERLAFVGPNGAGKSTVVKMLAGILTPTTGTARVLGLSPAADRRRLAYRIGAVFGQRSQLWYHLPARDSYALLARMYGLDPTTATARLAELTDRFGIADLATRPVRQLSLGERMRCELVAALLHKPLVLFLDEPTIGLDVTAKAAVRDLVRDAAGADGCTVLLTSHDTGDIEGVCDRVVVIAEGRLALDDTVAGLKRRVLNVKRVTVRTAAPTLDLDLPGVTVLASDAHVTRCELAPTGTAVEALIHAVLARTQLLDLTVEDPPMEEVVRRIYANAAARLGPEAAP